MVRALAMRHSRIADLAVSFPALLFALAVPRPRLDPACALARVVDGRALAEVAAAADLYGGSFSLLERVFKPWGLAARYTEDASPAGFRKIFTPATKLVWVETPTNPLLQIVDIAAIAELAHQAGALLAVDNTFASPYLQQPIRLGADIVVHSTTKYLGGHSDVVGGAVVGRRDLLQNIAFYQNAAGGVPGPFDAWLTLRGVKTLAVRMDRHCSNARRLAEWLRRLPRPTFKPYEALHALSCFRHGREVYAALAVLQQMGYVRERRPPATGQAGRPPGAVYAVNPRWQGETCPFPVDRTPSQSDKRGAAVTCRVSA